MLLSQTGRTVTVNGAAQVEVALCKTKQSDTGKGLNEWVQTKVLGSGNIW